MENLGQLNNFDFNNYSDIDDYLKPTNSSIQKDFVDSLTNLSNLLSNGLLYINYGIYENLSKQNNDNGSRYNVPKDCKLLSNVISKGVKNNFNQFKNSQSKNNNSIDIIVTDVDKENEFIEDEDIFGIDQSMIKSQQDFNFADSSMLFDQSAIFSNLDIQGDNMANQSMIFMDANGRNIITNEDPVNHSTMFLNINNLNENAEGNNSTLVNLIDADNNYLSTSDNESNSNNSTACWTDDRVPGPINESEEYSEDEDENLMDGFNQAFGKKKFTNMDIQDLKKHSYPRPNSRQKVGNHVYPSSSAIQVNQCQVFPEPWNEYDDINLAKATIMKQGLKNGFPHKKLYPVTENPIDEANSEINDNSSFISNTPYKKGFVNIYRYNNDTNDTMNSSISFIKDELSITKDIVNKNVKKFNSMGLENEEDVYIQKNNPSNSSFSNLSFISVSSNTASQNYNRNNAQSPQPDVKYSSISNDNVIESVNNFATLQSKFNLPIKNDENQELSSKQSNHIWKYKIKQQHPLQESISSNDGISNAHLETSIKDDLSPEDEMSSFNVNNSSNVNSSVVIPDKVNIKDRISNIEASIIVDKDNSAKEEYHNEQPIIEVNPNDTMNTSITNTTIRDNNNEDVLNDSAGTVKDIINIVENSSNQSINNGKIETITEPIILVETKADVIEKEELDEEQPLEFLSDHEEKEEAIEFLSDEEEPIEYLPDIEKQENKFENNENVEKQSIIFENDAEALINENIINGNLEDHIIIEEEDSIVGNAIEEALENKSLVIQESSFMDEPFANDLSFTFDGHAAFHEAMKIFEEGSTPLETIQEENEEEMEIENEKQNIVEEKRDTDINEEKIFEMIESNINEQGMTSKNDITIHSLIHKNDAINNVMLPTVNINIPSESKQFIEPPQSEIVISEQESMENKIISKKETPNNLKVESIEKEPEEVIDSDLKAIAMELEEMMKVPTTKSQKPKKNLKKENKVQVKSTKSSINPIKKPVVDKSITKSKTTNKVTAKPKKVAKKISKSLVLPTRNLKPSGKVDNMVGSKCVKAFTSSNLKQNIINIHPVEHEVAVSFSDFDKNIKSKPITKLNVKSESKPITKPINKPISKSISKPKPKINSKTILKSSINTSSVFGPNVKPLTKSKLNKSKPIEIKSISKINKPLSSTKSITKISGRKGNYCIIFIYLYFILNDIILQVEYFF